MKDLENFCLSRFVQVLKHGFLLIGPDFDEVVSEIYSQLSSLHDFPESVCVLLNPKQNGQRGVVHNVRIWPLPSLKEKERLNMSLHQIILEYVIKMFLLHALFSPLLKWYIHIFHFVQSIPNTVWATSGGTTFLRYASVRYMIFCGAPGHFTGVLGKEKTALPSLKSWRAFQVFCTVFTE